MKIKYGNIDALNEGVYSFVRMGLMFEADADKLTIAFTGGY